MGGDDRSLQPGRVGVCGVDCCDFRVFIKN